jgi:SAM-dependent methyltransferase
MYVDSRLVDGEPNEIYVGPMYGFRRSPQTDAMVDGRPHATRVLDRLERLVDRGSLLDVGCATGEFMIVAGDRGWEVCGVEVSPYASMLAERRGLEVVTGTLTQAGFADASFDVVTMLDVVEHLEAPLAELIEVRRILRPGGVLVMETPNWNSIYRRILRRDWPALQPRVHLFFLDPQSGGSLVRRAMLAPVFMETEIGGLFSPEGLARGIGPATVRNRLRRAVVGWRLQRPPGRIDGFMLRAAGSGQSDGAHSFKHEAECLASTNAQDATAHVSGSFWRRVNGPFDSLINRQLMGDQLRIYARRE